MNNITKTMILISVAALSGACGGLKVTADLDDSDLERIASFFGDDNSSDDSDDNDDDSDDAATVEADDEYFIGTFSEKEIDFDYYTEGEYCGDYYDFPGTMRAYNDGDALLFTDRNDETLFTADYYEDDSFDFDVTFADELGNPDIAVECSCVIEEDDTLNTGAGTQDDDTREIHCACDSNEDVSCVVYYEAI